MFSSSILRLIRSSSPLTSSFEKLKVKSSEIICGAPKASYSFSFRSSKSKSEDELDLAKVLNADETKETSLVSSESEEVALTDPIRGPLPIITQRQLDYLPFGRTPRQAWVDNLDTVEEKKLGLIDLHPDVFGTFPRLELIHGNIKWQQLYKRVDWTWRPRRSECRGTTKKPWPQKGLGKARHGARTSPIFKGTGGKAHGPRGPKTFYYMLGYDYRVHGLTSTLSVKLAQDDLKIVDTLDIPTDDPNYLEELVNTRQWGVSVLFVDDSDIAPKNLALATDSIGHMNIMPVYGLNVYSMLKHETLVLTIAAVNKIEERLIQALNRHDMNLPTARKHGPGAFL